MHFRQHISNCDAASVSCPSQRAQSGLPHASPKADRSVKGILKPEIAEQALLRDSLRYRPWRHRLVRVPVRANRSIARSHYPVRHGMPETLAQPPAAKNGPYKHFQKHATPVFGVHGFCQSFRQSPYVPHILPLRPRTTVSNSLLGGNQCWPDCLTVCLPTCLTVRLTAISLEEQTCLSL